MKCFSGLMAGFTGSVMYGIERKTDGKLDRLDRKDRHIKIRIDLEIEINITDKIERTTERKFDRQIDTYIQMERNKYSSIVT